MTESGLTEIVVKQKVIQEEHCAECAACLDRDYWKCTDNLNLNPEQRAFEAERLIKGLCGNCDSRYYKDCIYILRTFLNNIVNATKRAD